MQLNRQIRGHAIAPARHIDVGKRERLKDGEVVDASEAATQLPDVERLTLVNGHGAAERGVVDVRVAGKVDPTDCVRRSDPDARGHVRRLAGALRLHFGCEVEPALRLGDSPLVEQALAQRVGGRGSREAHLAHTSCLFRDSRTGNTESQA
jgi:hypothetical protein